MAVTADHVSGGRVELGLGAGWLEAEHRAYGFPFEPTKTRMDVLAEQLEIIHSQWKPGPFSFAGDHYRIENLDALPKPVQKPHPLLIVGGSGGPRSLALAARFADEYNTPFAAPERCRELRARFDEACEKEGRERLPLSVMIPLGPLSETAEQLRKLEDVGVERVMLQHPDHTDIDAVEAIGRLGRDG
jgi:alkanesulfonate monooxygenase SsuD/methylene tetrahydromethanopterin reductase-like flavin-dependent oxidoreductase (luciferase family)